MESLPWQIDTNGTQINDQDLKQETMTATYSIKDEEAVVSMGSSIKFNKMNNMISGKNHYITTYLYPKNFTTLSDTPLSSGKEMGAPAQGRIELGSRTATDSGIAIPYLVDITSEQPSQVPLPPPPPDIPMAKPIECEPTEDKLDLVGTIPLLLTSEKG